MFISKVYSSTGQKVFPPALLIYSSMIGLHLGHSSMFLYVITSTPPLRLFRVISHHRISLHLSTGVLQVNNFDASHASVFPVLW